jgi:hypothetical protein
MRAKRAPKPLRSGTSSSRAKKGSGFTFAATADFKPASAPKPKAKSNKPRFKSLDSIKKAAAKKGTGKVQKVKSTKIERKDKLDDSNIEDAVIVHDSPKSESSRSAVGRGAPKAVGAPPKTKKSSTPRPPGAKREAGRAKPMKVGQQFTEVNTKGEATRMTQTKYGPAVNLDDV